MFKCCFIDFDELDPAVCMTDVGPLPSSWIEFSFSQLLVESKEKVGNRTIPEYSITNTGIHPRESIFNKTLSKTLQKNKVMRRGQLGFGMSREILNWGIFSDEIGCVSPAYRVYEVREDIPSFYLEGYIKYHEGYFKSLIKGSSREGQSLDVASLMGKKIYLPSQAELARFEGLSTPLLTEKKRLSEETDRLEQTRDQMLPRLMSGEIDVDDIEV